MAAQFVSRVHYGDSASAALFPGTVNNHPEESLVVIDWITLRLDSSSGGVCEFIITDQASGNDDTLVPGYLYDVAIQVAAGESDTVHIPFPGGMPLKRPRDSTTALLEGMLDGRFVPILAGNVSYTFTGATTGGTAFVGWHVERETNRR